jgi:PHD/YefM family antitoxin component YafN of YafNO toxin-antitoxin module
MAIEIRAAELASLDETAHLLGSPRNAQRLRRALRRADREGKNSAYSSLSRNS